MLAAHQRLEQETGLQLGLPGCQLLLWGGLRSRL